MTEQFGLLQDYYNELARISRQSSSVYSLLKMISREYFILFLYKLYGQKASHWWVESTCIYVINFHFFTFPVGTTETAGLTLWFELGILFPLTDTTLCVSTEERYLQLQKQSNMCKHLHDETTQINRRKSDLRVHQPSSEWTQLVMNIDEVLWLVRRHTKWPPLVAANDCCFRMPPFYQ